MRNRLKLLVVGSGRHGKDTVAEYFRDHFGMTFKSSSHAAAEIFIFDYLKERYGYETFEECFQDRVNHRAEWHNLIVDYNKDDKARLAKGIMKDNDCYVGMRSGAEIDKCMEDGIFDLIIWVDRSEHLPEEDKSSFNIDKSLADIIIDNNGTLEELYAKLDRIGTALFTPIT